MPDSSRHPPGQYLTRDFPVTHVGSVPHFDRANWTLRVAGLVESPLTLTYAEFSALPRVDRTTDFHCVATWTRYDLAWSGVLAREIFERARPAAGAKYVLVHADGGYTTNLPLAALLEDDVLVADRLGGEPLPIEHGGPVRLVVPRRYGYKSAKWLRTLEITPEERAGFWESRGYSMTADPFTEDRFAPPGEPLEPATP